MSVLLAMSVAASLGFPGPTIAGPPPPRPRAVIVFNPGVSRDVRDVRSEVREGRERRELSKRQARELRRELGEIAMLERRYAAGGLSEAERAELRARVEMARALTRAKRAGAVR